MSADPVEDIADALVTFLNDDKSEWGEQPEIVFTAVKNADPTKELTVENLATTQVFVAPYGETGQKIGRGGQALETYQVFLLVVRGITTEFTRTKLAEFVRQLKLAIRKGGKMAGYHWRGDETTAKYQLEALTQVNHFASSIRFDYSGTA